MPGERRVSVSIELVQLLLKYAADLGDEVDEITDLAGIQPGEIQQSGQRIPARKYFVLAETVAKRSGDPDFGLHFVERSRSYVSGSILSAVMVNCPTIEKALEKQICYHDLTTDFVQLRLDLEEDYAHYSWVPVDIGIPLDRQITEAVLSGMFFTLKGLSQGEMPFVEIRFEHPQPESITEHQRIFGCPVKFGQPWNEIVIRREGLDLPIFMSNPTILTHLEGIARELLDKLYFPETWGEKVTGLISQMLLKGEKPALPVIAASLAISSRHLQNKLKEEGLTYRRLLDQVRKEMALRYLDESEFTMYDIAFLLGFSEQSGFNHAFKRWTGTNPSDYR